MDSQEINKENSTEEENVIVIQEMNEVEEVEIQVEEVENLEKAKGGSQLQSSNFISVYFSCKRCHKIFTSLQNLDSHEKNCCQNKTQVAVLQTGKIELQSDPDGLTTRSSSSSTKSGKTPNNQEEKRPNQCDICYKIFSSPSTLKIHKLIHAGEKPHKCMKCNYAARNTGSLRWHIGKYHSQEENASPAMSVQYIQSVHNYASIQSAKPTPIRPPNLPLNQLSPNNLSSTQSDCNVTDRKVPQNLSVDRGGVKFFSCFHCNYTAQDTTALEDHSRLNHGEQLYYCTKCKFKSNSKETLKTHMNLHIGKSPYCCKLCNFKSPFSSNFNRHMRMHTGTKRYACNYCDFRSVDSSCLKVHVRVKHTGEKPYECSICHFKGVTRGSVLMHMKVHSNDRPFACTQCEFKAKTKTNLTTHMKLHTGVKHLSCSDCGFKTFHHQSFKRHKLTHSGKGVDKPHLCTVCGARFETSFALKEHTRGHTGEKPFLCTQCPYQVSRKRLLDTHMLIHMVKTIACSQCKYKTNKKSDLRIHMRKHTGEKPYSCSWCDYKNATSTGLKVHVRNNHDESKHVSCDQCEFKSIRKEVKKHRLAVHFERVFSCPYCDYQTEKEKIIKAHVRRIHEQKDISTQPKTSNSDDANYSCEVCHVSFSTSLDLNEHKNLGCKMKPSSEKIQPNKALQDLENLPKVRNSDTSPTVHKEQEAIISVQEENIDTGNVKNSSLIPFTNDNSASPPSTLESPLPSPLPSSNTPKASAPVIYLKASVPILKLPQPTSTVISLKTATIPSTTSPLKLPSALPSTQPPSPVLLPFYPPSQNSYILAYVPASQPTTAAESTAITSQLVSIPVSTSTSSLPPLLPKPTLLRPSEPSSFLSCPNCDCNYKASDIYMLKTHIKTHVKEKPLLSCQYCTRKFRKNAQLQMHLRLHTGEKPYSCTECGFKTRLNSFLKQHMKIHTGVKPYSCKKCPFKSCDESNLRRHIRTHTGEKRHVCTYCDFRTSDGSSLKNHIKRKHTKEKPFSCTVCDFKAVSKSSIGSHMKTHTGYRPYACTHCEFRASQKNNFVEHMRIHTGEKPYLCSICGFRTARRKVLTLHTQNHLGEKPHQCDLCEARFLEKSSLKKHMRVHTGEKPFPCSECEAKFTKKTGLQRHMLVHTGESFFSCTHCKFRTNQKALLNVHKKTHFTKTTKSQSDDNVQIHEVTEAYSYSLSDEGLIVHTTLDNDDCESESRRIEVEDSKKVFSCPLCGYQCTKKSVLGKHMKQNHISV